MCRTLDWQDLVQLPDAELARLDSAPGAAALPDRPVRRLRLGGRNHLGRRQDTDAFQPEDSFVCGAIQGDGGTCGNLPIVYDAVGRRLGYPIMPATTRSHGFCRGRA